MESKWIVTHSLSRLLTRSFTSLLALVGRVIQMGIFYWHVNLTDQ